MHENTRILNFFSFRFVVRELLGTLFDKKIIENLKKIGKTEKACGDSDLPCFMWGLSV